MSVNGRKLKALRIEAGLTQKELAERLGLKEHRITWFETNRAQMTVPEVVDVARILGVAPEVLDSTRFSVAYKD